MDLIDTYCVETQIDMFYEGKHPGFKERMNHGILTKLGYEIAKFIEQNKDKEIVVRIIESESRIEYVLGVCDIRAYRKEARFYDATDYSFYERK